MQFLYQLAGHVKRGAYVPKIEFIALFWCFFGYCLRFFESKVSVF